MCGSTTHAEIRRNPWCSDTEHNGDSVRGEPGWWTRSDARGPPRKMFIWSGLVHIYKYSCGQSSAQYFKYRQQCPESQTNVPPTPVDIFGQDAAMPDVSDAEPIHTRANLSKHLQALELALTNLPRGQTHILGSQSTTTERNCGYEAEDHRHETVRSQSRLVQRCARAEIHTMPIRLHHPRSKTFQVFEA